MRDVKRVLGLSLALVVLAGAGLTVRALDQRRVAASRTEAEHTAEVARQRATDALRLQIESLEIKASAASTLQPLIVTLGLLRQNGLEAQLVGTLQDFFRDEKTWEPYRKQFKVFGLSIDGNELQIVQGIAPRDLTAQPLLRQAREKGRASGTVMGKNWPYAAAATNIVVPSLSEPVTLVLARPFDEGMLREAAERAGGAVMLSDGHGVLAQSGSKKELERLSGAIGQEQKGALVAPDGTWAAADAPIAPGLWLWTEASTLAAAREAAESATTTKGIVWSAAVLLAGLALLLGLRRPKASVAPQSGGVVTREPTPVLAAASTPSSVEPAPRRPTPPAPASSASPAPGISGLDSTLHAGVAPLPRTTVGQPFGRYLLLERLGEGGMSHVYTAVTFGAEGFRRKFVVKRLRPELANDPVVVAQFTDEANLASSLVHSNIVPVFDFGKEGDEYYMATEYILGRDLGRVTRRVLETDYRPLPVELVLHCAHETLRALEYAHTRHGEKGEPLGIVHRDVSPGNILVSARGEVKLFDFGIVKAEGRVTQTEHGVVKGNVSFMSPEQARGTPTDARADLFSLGLVIYYCLTGEVLYRGNTTYELLVKAASGPGADEVPRIQALPGVAAHLVARALQIEPSARFQSAAEFAAAIAPHLRSVNNNELGATMQRLFADEFREEEKRFATAVPDAAASPGSASPQVSSRR